MTRAKRPDTWLICPGIREWHDWLASHHKTETQVWLQIRRAHARETGITLSEAVEEALCFGWIDGLMLPLDSEKYLLRMTPRRPDSLWSKSNRLRAERLIRQGKMMPAGMVPILEAQARGTWQSAYTAKELPPLPEDLKAALLEDPSAAESFADWSDSQKLQAIVWLQQSRKAQTRIDRIQRILRCARQGERLH